MLRISLRTASRLFQVLPTNPLDFPIRAAKLDPLAHTELVIIDLCVRLRQKNYRLLVSYRSVIEHHASVSPGRKKYDDENRERFLTRWQAVTKVWGKREWPAQYVHRYARAWWKMVPWRMAQGICILAYGYLSAGIPNRRG